MEPHVFIYLSPHPDDAALSCGGAIRTQCMAGHRVLILTVCAGDPGEGPFSELAERFHAAMAPSDQLASARRAEDWAAARLLGCEMRQLDVPDAIYRHTDGIWMYGSLEALLGLPAPEDTALPVALRDALADVVTAEPAPVLIAPLALGGHVDHRQTRRCAETLGVPLLYYEEFPYGDPEYPGLPGMGSAGMHPANAQFLSGVRPFHRAVSVAAMERKIAAVRAYHTQIPLVFRDTGEVADRLKAYARRPGSEGFVEQFWISEFAAGPVESF